MDGGNSMQSATAMTSYLAVFDATPDDKKLALVREWMAVEPLPFFRELREKRPILATPACTLVARFSDVTEVLSKPDVFTVSLYKPKMKDFLMTHDGDALHTREKSIMRAMLNRDDLPFVRKMVADIAKGILDGAGGKIEAVNNYCRMVPVTLVQEYFGLRGVDRKDLIEWSYWNQYDAFHNQPFDQISDEMRRHISESHEKADTKLAEYLAVLIAVRLVQVKEEQVTNFLLFPIVWLKRLVRWILGRKSWKVTDDIVMRMLRTSYPKALDFDIQRLGLNAGGLLIGAVETTSQAATQVIAYLLAHKEWLDEAVRASERNDTAAFDGIVWEALRFVPIAPFLFRQAASDYTIAAASAYATEVKAGTIVLALTQSAMFDESSFEKPDAFIPGRSWYQYFHLGFGTHECLGKYVAMVLIPETVRQILIRPGLSASGPIDYKSGPFPEHYELSWRAQ
jgi:cytochrome P450